MTVMETSLESYYLIKDKLGPLHRKILNIIRVYPNVSNREIGVIGNIPINVVTPRVKELRALGLVSFSYKKMDRKTNRWVMTWVAVP